MRIGSEIALPAPSTNHHQVDVRFAWGETIGVPLRPPGGKLLSHRDRGDGQGWSLVETPSGFVMRAHGLFDFRIDRPGRQVAVHPAPGAQRELAPLFLLGNVAAVIMSLAGEYPLHASAVATPAGAIAFLGSVNSGKSTLAALCCAAGARLVTDDLLRLAPDSGGFRCLPGPDQVRLRPAAAAVASHFRPTAVGRTADGRIEVRLGADHGRPRLRGIVVPSLARRWSALRLEPLTLPQAHYLLLGHARIGSWVAPEPLRAQFTELAAVARSVPVYRAEIPWGAPYSVDLASELLAATGLAPNC